MKFIFLLFFVFSFNYTGNTSIDKQVISNTSIFNKYINTQSLKTKIEMMQGWKKVVNGKKEIEKQLSIIMTTVGKSRPFKETNSILPFKIRARVFSLTSILLIRNDIDIRHCSLDIIESMLTSI